VCSCLGQIVRLSQTVLNRYRLARGEVISKFLEEGDKKITKSGLSPAFYKQVEITKLPSKGQNFAPSKNFGSAKNPKILKNFSK